MKTLCISHLKDVDGIVSAALLHHLSRGKFVLVNYGNLKQELRKVREGTELLYLCDLGLNATFLKEIRRIREFADIAYIDHHPLKEELRRELANLGVELVHDIRECTGVLVYQKFKEVLPWKARLLASCAAVSDYAETGPLAQEILNRFDRQLVFLETMLLSHALERNEDVSFKRLVVTKLAAMEYPHKIKNIPEFALEVLEKNTSLLETLPKEVKKAGRVGYVESESSSGTIASLIITACGVDVGLSYKCISEKNVCDVSIRGAGNLRLDLGKLASRISEKRGGFGGGHPKASGARVPYTEIQSFVQEFAENVNSQLGS